MHNELFSTIRYDSELLIRVWPRSVIVMAESKTILENDAARLKDTPRPEDLEATTSPAARLLAWLRA